MSVGAEEGKSLISVDLTGVGWQFLWCVASGSLMSHEMGLGVGTSAAHLERSR